MSLRVLYGGLIYGIIAINTAVFIVNNAQGGHPIALCRCRPRSAAENRFLSRCGECAKPSWCKMLKNLFFFALLPLDSPPKK